ncbi:hypothetical protein FACS1894167_12870 [Synergistales bacterium]|nr:hypothetical protein FACS1894167_12870 [Synergistales bacterium]
MYSIKLNGRLGAVAPNQMAGFHFGDLISTLLVLIFTLLIAASPLFAADRSVVSDSYIFREENPEKLMFTVHIPMTIWENALVIFPDGKRIEMGRVRAVPVKSHYPGFTASKYGLGGQIIAAAANAHHIQIQVDDGAGRTMSVLPSATFADASGSETSFVVEGEGGAGLWGKYSPFVGSPVYMVNQAGIPVLFNHISLFQYATAIEIRVYAPDDIVDYIEIENTQGGQALYHDASGYHQFAVVEAPVGGTGRFTGTLYQGVGMVRANHPGVICISTSRHGQIGGFQIVPLSHTYSKELQKTRRMSQYIILRGPEFDDITGRPPFFRGYIRPGDWEDPSYHINILKCKIDGKWVDVPEVPGLTEGTLSNIEAFRLYLRKD